MKHLFKNRGNIFTVRKVYKYPSKISLMSNPLKINPYIPSTFKLLKIAIKYNESNYTQKMILWKKYNLDLIHVNTIWIDNKKFSILSRTDEESYQYFNRKYFNDDGTLNKYSIDYDKKEEIELLKPLAKNFHSWRKKSFSERLKIWENNNFIKLHEYSISIEENREDIFTIYPTNDEEIVYYFEFLESEYIQPKLNKKKEQFQLSLDNVDNSLHTKNVEGEILETEKYLPTKNDGLNSYLKNGFVLCIKGHLRPPYITLSAKYFNEYFFNGIVLGKYYQYLHKLKNELKEGKLTSEPEIEDDQEKNWNLKERYYMLKKLGLDSFERSNDYNQTNKHNIISIVLDCNISTAKSLINSYDKYKINEDEINRVETYLFNKKKKEK